MKTASHISLPQQIGYAVQTSDLVMPPDIASMLLLQGVIGNGQTVRSMPSSGAFFQLVQPGNGRLFQVQFRGNRD